MILQIGEYGDKIIKIIIAIIKKNTFFCIVLLTLWALFQTVQVHVQGSIVTYFCSIVFTDSLYI